MCLTTIIGTFSALHNDGAPPSQVVFLPAQWPDGYYDIASCKPELSEMFQKGHWPLKVSVSPDDFFVIFDFTNLMARFVTTLQ